MSASPAARVVRSVQLTFTGQVASASARGGLVPGARHRRRARVLHADDRRYTLHARTVLSRRRGGRHHPNAAESAAPRERVAGRVAAAGPRLGECTARRPALGDSRRGRRTASPRCGRGPRRRLVSRRQTSRLCPRRGVVRGRQRRERTAEARDDARPRVLAALVPGRRALAIHGRLSPQGDTRSLWEVSAEGHGLRPVPLGRGEARRGLLRRVESGRAAFLLQAVPRQQDRHLGHPGEEGAVRRESHRTRARDERTAVILGCRSDPGRPAVAGHRRPDRGARTCGSIWAGANSRRTTREGGPGGSPSRETESGWPTSSTARGNDLWRSRVDGSERLQLTQPPLRLLLPRWSPDGTRIAFMGRTPGRPWKIYVIAAEGGEPQPIPEGDRPESDPDWAPDGSL